MKTILVPTDFSPVAENALHYAAELNKKLNYEILLFHAYEVPMPVTDVPIMPPDEEFRVAAMDSLNKLKENFNRQYPQMQIKVEASMGNSNNEIIRMENKTKCSLVVMGSYGDNAMHHLVAGKHVAPVINKSGCPVLVIPMNVQYQELSKIVYAVNFGVDDLANSMSVTEMASAFDAEVIILHILTKEHGRLRQQAEIEKFRVSVIELSGYNKVSIKLLESDNVFEGINLYVVEINADMLVVNMRELSLMDRIFNRSLTKKIAYHSKTPLMVMHTALE